MVTKGIIKSIDLKGNTCTVHMPFFETAGNDPIIGTAIISNTPGSYNGYKVGDVVLVAFEDGAMETPVVMGKLYLGAEAERADPRGVLNVENSTVSNSATMPADTKLAAQIDSNVPNTTVPYGSLSSIANELNILNTNVGQMDRDYGNRFKQVITSIGEQGEELSSKIEQSAEEISAEVSRVETDLDGRITANSAAIKVNADSITNSVTEINKTIDGKVQELEGKIETTSSGITASVTEQFKAVEKNITDLESNVNNELDKKIDLENKGLSQKGFGWKVDNESWTIKAFDQNNEGSLPEDGLDIFKITRDEVVINTPYVTLSGYPKDTIIRYAKSDSTTKHPDAYKDANKPHTDKDNINTVWTEEIPTWEDGKYIWRWTQLISYEYDKEYKSSTGSTGAWNKISASDRFECLAGTSAVSLWLNCSTNTHAGSQQKEKIEITAMAKVGTGEEKEDTAATLEYRWGSDGELVSANSYELIIENTKDTPILDKNLIIIAKRNGKVYTSTTIYFSPLNTPILILSGDSASIAYNSYGDTKIDEKASVKIEAEVLLNNKEMPDVEYSWELDNCTNDTIISESTSWKATITNTDNIIIYHIAEDSSYATATCTATYKDNLGNETDLVKTFIITKNLQGKSQYKLDIFNEFVTFPVNYNTTEINETNTPNIKTLTTHEVSALYGDTLVEFISYIEGSAPDTFEAKQFYLKVVPSNNITLNPDIVYSNTLQTKLENNITKLNGEDQTTGYITYELYRGEVKVASAKFESSMIHNGTPVTRSWLVIDKLVHTGTTETKTITVQPKIETGNSGADNDLTAIIECRYLGEVKPDGTLGAPSSIPSKNNVAKDENSNPISTYFECDQDTKAVTIYGPFKNQDIEIKAKHGASVYETEIITYIPQDTPGLDLDNDGDFIPYTPSGNKIGTSTVKSKAKLLLNQEEISGITYTWTLDGCVLKDDEDEVKQTTFEGQTIEIEYLTKERATATCKVIYLGKEYSKTFSIVKQISAASYWVAVSQPVHSGAEQDVALTACAKKNEGLVVEADDEGAILWYRFKNDTTWTASTSKFKLEIAKTSFKDQDLYIIATHDSNFEPDEDTAKTEDDIYAWETIMFSSSTPILNFEPDVGFIIYDAENTKLNADNNKAIVTAGLYKNGLLLPANEVTYVWTPVSCSGEQDSSNSAKFTVNEIDANVNIAKVICEATYAGRKYTNEFTVIKQVNATTYWIKTSCLVHKGAEQQQNVNIIAMRKDGTNPETQDNLAYLWWKYESATEWTQVTGATPYAITIAAGKENGTGKIKPEDILVLATHKDKDSFNPNAEGINILTDVNIYDQETIEYSPLDTPTINLDEDRGALVYDADGNKIGNASAETTAAIWYNGERLDHSSLDYSCNWTYGENYTCEIKQGKNDNGAYLEVSKISAESVTFTCTITIDNKGIDGNGAFANKTYTKNFTVVRQIKGDPTIRYDILPSVKQLKARANSELYEEYGDSITFNIIKSRGLETPKAINYADESEAEADLTVKISKDGGNLEEYTQDPDGNNTYTISLLKASETKITNGIIIELYNNNVLISKVTVDVIKDGADGDAANSYWISCPRQHLGKNNGADISVKAYKQIGNEVSAIDTEAWLRYKVKSKEEFSEWFAINELENNTLIISKSTIENENIIIQAAHLITSDEDSIYNEYDEEIIDYTPLNTPTLVIEGDRHVIRYLLNGNELENITGNVVSTAAVYEGLTELTDISYSWSVEDEDSANIIFSGQDTNTITISDIKTNRVVITCTATVNERFDDLGNAFVVQKEITVDKEVLTSNYRLKISTPIHTGVTQLDNIKIEALATLGNESEKPDEKAYLRYSLDNGKTWENESEDGGWTQDSTLEISSSSCADSNIIVQYTHDKNTILENETITYSPLNTPIIDLTNDTASIVYYAEGNKIEEDDFVVSTAKVWLNGKEHKAIDENTNTTNYTYYWLLENCTAEGSKTQISEGTTYNIVESNSVKVITLTGNTNTAKAIFKVKFINGTYAGLELEKEFTISKQIKGDKGDDGKDGISPIKLEIENDYDSIPCDYEGQISNDYAYATQTLHKLRLYEGITPVKFKVTNETLTNYDGYVISYSIEEGITANLEQDSGTDPVETFEVSITKFENDTISKKYEKAKITYNVYKGTNKTVLATNYFTVEKRYSSAPTVKIDIVNDFVSVPCDSNKVINWNNDTLKIETTHTIHVYEGLIKKEFKVVNSAPTTNDNYYYVYQTTTSGVTASKSSTDSFTDEYYNNISKLNADAGSITYKLYKGTALIGSVKFEATKIVAGAPGESYKLISSASQIKQNKLGNKTPKSITFNAIKQLGNLSADKFDNAYFKVYIDGIENSSLRGTKNNGEYKFENISNITSELKVEIYYDENYTVLLDRETIPVVVDGEDLVDYYILTDINQVIYNPNTNTYTPEEVTVTFWEQVGSGEPKPLTNELFKYKVDDDTPKSVPASGSTDLKIAKTTSISLYNNENVLLDTETISLITDGNDGDSIVKTSKQYLLLKDLHYTNVQAQSNNGDDANIIIGFPSQTIPPSEDGDTLTSSQYQLFTEDFQADLFKEYNSDSHKIFVREKYTYSSGTTTYSEFREEKVVEEVFALKQGKSTNYYGPVDPAGSEGSPTYGNNMVKGDCWFDTSNYGYELDPKYTSFTTAEKYIDYYLKIEENNEISYIKITETNLHEMINDTNAGKEEAYKKVLQPTLKQWSVLATFDDGSSTYGWKDIGGEIVENKVTANYINAMDITAKRIEILDTDNKTTLFKADGLDGNHEVKIAGFTVESNTLTAGTASNNTYVQLGTEAIMLGGDSTDTAPFSVTKAGYLIATSGEIGGFNISSTSIASGDKVGKTLDAGANLSGVYIGPDGISIGKGFKVTAGEAGNTEITLSDKLMNELKAATYTIISSTSQVVKDPITNNYSPASVEFTFYKQLGSDTPTKLTNKDTTFAYSLNGGSTKLGLTVDGKITTSTFTSNSIICELYLIVNPSDRSKDILIASKTVSILNDAVSPYTLDIYNDKVSALTNTGNIDWTKDQWETNTTHKIKVLHGTVATKLEDITVRQGPYTEATGDKDLVLVYEYEDSSNIYSVESNTSAEYEVINYITKITSEADKHEINYTLYYRKVAVATAKFELLKIQFGENGRSIESVTNYYFATTTNSNSDLPPKTAISEDTKDADKGYWQTSITKTGYGTSAPYLWNFEQIIYDKELNGKKTSETAEEIISYYASDGSAATTHWIKGVETTHAGSNQTATISVTAMKRVGNGAEQVDSGTTGAVIWYNNDGTWKSRLGGDNAANCHTLNFNPGKFYDGYDIKLILTHDKTWRPDASTNSTDSHVEEWEVITYSPATAPVIDLSNDSAQLYYANDTKAKNEVSSTAALYLAGKKLESANISYSWAKTNGTSGNCTFKNNITNTDTITITAIDEDSASVTCTISINSNGIDGKFKNTSYQKTFNITKVRDGKGISEVIELYQLTASTTSQPQKPDTPEDNDWRKKGWSKTIQQPDASNPYLWNVEITIYTTNNNYDYNITNPAIIGTYGETFGVNIEPSVSSIKIQYKDGEKEYSPATLTFKFREVSGTNVKDCCDSDRKYRYRLFKVEGGTETPLCEYTELTNANKEVSLNISAESNQTTGQYKAVLELENHSNWVIVDSESIPVVLNNETLSCVIESTLGTSFNQSSTGYETKTTTLIAHLYKGMIEEDSDHTYYYEWYEIDNTAENPTPKILARLTAEELSDDYVYSDTYNNKLTDLEREDYLERKQFSYRGEAGSHEIALKLKELENKSIYFIVYPGGAPSTGGSILGIARLGMIPLGK